MAHARLKTLLCVALIGAAGSLTYGQVVGFSYVTEDDHRLIRKNPTVTDWAAPGADRALTRAFGYAIPVTVASWALDWQLYGGAAWGLHLTNLLLHLACGLVLFFAARRLTGDLPALAGALLLLLHPLVAEPVSFVTQRKDLLATLFVLLALERTLAALRRDRPAIPLALALAFATLAGLSKPTALLCGPALVAVYWLLRPTGSIPRSTALLGLSLLGLAPTLLVLNLVVNRMQPSTVESLPGGVEARLALIAHSLTHYAQSLLVPLSLSPKVPRPTLTLSAQTVIAALAVVIGGAGLGGWLWRKRHHAGLAAWCFCLAAYLPVSNLVPVKRYVADSYLYLVLAGLGVGLALALERLVGSGERTRRRRIVALGAAGVVLLGYGALSHRQAGVWRNEGTLFGYLYRLYPNQADAEAQYVAHLQKTGKRQRARTVRRDFLQRALTRRPGDAAARHRLMRLYLRAGLHRQARALLAAAPPAHAKRVAHWEAWLEYAMARRDYGMALRAVRAILALDPTSPRKKLLPELTRRAPR